MGQDFSKFLDGLQNIQGKAQDIQAGLKAKTVEGVAGGGLVKVTANGFGEVSDIVVDGKLLSSENLPMLRKLLLQAINEAIGKSRGLAVSEVFNAMGGPPNETP
ncbi:MAG TPA: YbaB/EbfC family nucleoid-associated protein [Firmicutes bacterium]|nr:YbaB/EbfC family nucleoid-associated protein [Bacillota bacterium]